MRPETENARATAGASWKSALPAWDAVTVQTPAPVIVSASAASTQLPVARKLTGSPEDAVAVTVNGGSPNVRPGGGVKVMVWPARATPKARATSAAGS